MVVCAHTYIDRPLTQAIAEVAALPSTSTTVHNAIGSAIPGMFLSRRNYKTLAW